VLARHADVKDVAVIGEPDEKWGERVVAFVVPGGALTSETLDHHCRASGDLASFKRPRRFVFVAEIPKRPRARYCGDCCATASTRRCDHERVSPSRARRGRGDHLDRSPARMNTMTVAMRNEFPGIFAGLEADETVRVVVIRGAGGKAFSAGGDVSEFLQQEPADLELWGDTLTAAERCRKPVIAAIDGYTMGAGLELAVACDFRLATLRSEFAFPEVRLGMIPGSGGTQRALRLIGMTRGKLFMMTGQRITAERAEAWGLITMAVPNDKLDEAVAALPASWPIARRSRSGR
jgi:hypothetical protein